MLWALVVTLVLAIIFTAFQGIEYSASSFTISDGIFGSSFFFGTGFHGLTNAAPKMYLDEIKFKTLYKLYHNAGACASNTDKKLLITFPQSSTFKANSYYLETCGRPAAAG